MQIGQLTRTNKVVDNLDWYFDHSLPAYQASLPLIAMYVVFYDFCHFSPLICDRFTKNSRVYGQAYTVGEVMFFVGAVIRQ